MRAAISEFSYGFGFTHELVSRQHQNATAPKFLSLREEGQQGYDVHVVYHGIPLFFQFKLSDYLQGANSKYWDSHRVPYYRFSITQLRISDQHNQLKNLVQQGESHVYYAAPAFHTNPEFHRCFTAGTIVTRSLCLPVNNLQRLADYQQHHVSFHSLQDPIWHSDEEDIIKGDFSGERLLNDIEQQSIGIRTIDASYLLRLRNALAEIAGVSLAGLREGSRLNIEEPTSQSDDPERIKQDVVRLLSGYFGLEMVVASIPDNPSLSES